ncbi:hypothetical protein [Streptomyces sp. BH105]
MAIRCSATARDRSAFAPPDSPVRAAHERHGHAVLVGDPQRRGSR